MSSLSPFQDSIAARLAPHGLHLRGTVRFPQGEGGPLMDNGRAARSVLLIGNVGGSIWQAFSDWRASQPDRGGKDPLDRWSKSVIGAIATAAGATAYYPSDQPYQPFQRWAVMAEGLETSPLGILVHPEYGLWHGYRGALGFADELGEGERHLSGNHPCDTCRDKPCQTVCPVRAVAAGRFDVAACRRFLGTDPGRDSCMRKGCQARAACPVGPDYRYPGGQLRFHMEALDLPAC